MHLNTYTYTYWCNFEGKITCYTKTSCIQQINIQNKSGTQLDIMLTLHQIIFSILYLSITTVNILVQDHIHAP